MKKTISQRRKGGRVEKKVHAGSGLEPGTCRVLGECPQLHARGLFRQASLSVPIDRVGRLCNTKCCMFWRDFVRFYSVRVKSTTEGIGISWGHYDILVYTCMNVGFKNNPQNKFQVFSKKTPVNKDYAVSHHIWPPKLARFKKKQKQKQKTQTKTTTTTTTKHTHTPPTHKTPFFLKINLFSPLIAKCELRVSLQKKNKNPFHALFCSGMCTLIYLSGPLGNISSVVSNDLPSSS